MANNETPSEQLTGSLWDRIKDFFTGMWDNFWKVEPNTASPLVRVIWDQMSGRFADQAEDYFKADLKKVMADMNLPDEFQTFINTVTADGTFNSYMAGYTFTYYYYIQFISQHAMIAGEYASHQWRAQYQPTIPDVSTLILGIFRDPTDETRIRDELKKLGYSDERIQTLMKTARSIFSPDELKNLYLRGEIDDTGLKTGFKKYGFTDGDVEQLKKLFYPIPGYQDLIRMAVREAFYPDYVEQYGLLSEFPAEFANWAKKQGLSEEWAKKYWASHWELPSVLRGYEMLHRGVIKDEDLDKLFMAQDIMPYWRDKLKAISYHPLTRVDVRRVYRMGIIDRNQVKRTYLDLGYNDEKAEWLTKFTEMQNTEKERDLTRAQVISAYSKKIVSEDEARGHLQDMGYDKKEVDVIIKTRDWQDAQDLKDMKQDKIKKFYLAGVYSANQAISELGKLDLTGSEQSHLLELWDSEKLAKLDKPSKVDLGKFYSAGIINEDQYTTEMRELGFPQKYIGWYIESLKQAGEGG